MAYIYFFIMMMILSGFIYSICKNDDDKLHNLTTKKEQNHQENDSIIVLYKGEKYDVTKFAKYHPGGKEILQEYYNKDINQAMIDNKHSNHAYKLLEKYKIKNQ